MMQVRQEVLNVTLAELLQGHGLVAVPEEIIRRKMEPAKLPDVLVDFQGLRLAIEAEFASKPLYVARDHAYNKAQDRVDQAVAHIGIAVVYPPDLRSTPFDRLTSALQKAPLEFVILTEADLTKGLLFPTGAKPSFTKGTVNDLVDALRRSYAQLVRDEALLHAVQLLERGLELFTTALQAQPASTDRLAQVLGVTKLPAATPKNNSSHRSRMAVNRIAGLIIANAMIFQEVLSKSDRRVRPLHDFYQHPNIIIALLEHWQFILDKINYYPIFYTACELIRKLSPDVSLSRGITALMNMASTIVGWRASLRHDLAGRIYHKLLEEAKYLGAYYTAIPSAALLLKLALRPEGYRIDWSDLNALPRIRVADLACGTGTLLMAAADVVVDNYVHASVQKGQRPNLDNLHHVIVENMIYGYDVLPSAVHLTASTLSLRVPNTPINVTHLYRVPLGGPQDALGTLEFFQRDVTNGTLFGEPEEKAEQIMGTEKATRRSVRIPDLDLCVMNPPFTRSVGGNLLFGNLPEAERARLQTKLKKIVTGQRISASVTAGLGSVFVALADKYLKNNGRLALVLPRALISGVAWESTRQIISERYHLEYLIVSHEPDHWNFSENTDLSEVLLIARKLAPREKQDGAKVVCVNLWRQPRNAIESLSLARCLLTNHIPDLGTGRGALELNIGEEKYGEAVTVPQAELPARHWGIPCAFAQVELARALYYLMRGRLYLPAHGICKRMPLCMLEQLGELGFDCRVIHNGFNLSTGVTTYASFWNHDSRRVLTMRQEPNCWLKPLQRPKPGQQLASPDHLWLKASCPLIAERLWLNTMRLTSIRVTEKVLSNVWWSLILGDGRRSDNWQKAIVLWLNSTLGFLLLIGHREETRGAWVKFKKGILEKMPVLDLQKAGVEVRKKLAQAYDELCEKPLGSFPEMEHDPVRKAIDDAISDALGLPDVAPLRRMLAREPVVCLSLDGLIPKNASAASANEHADKQGSVRQ